MKKVDKFIYFYETLSFLDRHISKYIFQLVDTLQFNNKHFSDPIDKLIYSKLFIINYNLAKNLWKVYLKAEKKFGSDYFAGFVLIGSFAKGKGVLFGDLNRGDIDIVLVFRKYKEDFVKISKEINKLIFKMTGLKKCSFWNGENNFSVIFLDKIDEYLYNGQYEKFTFLFSPRFGDAKLKKETRKYVARLLLTEASDDFISKVEKRFKFNILPLNSNGPLLNSKFTKNKNKYVRNLSRLTNYIFQYLSIKNGKFLRATFKKLNKFDFRDLLEFYSKI